MVFIAHVKLVNNIREHRLQMDLTQEALAERSGVSLSTPRKFEQ
ncbi:helix-turn-helix domain-containing protein [Epilithonimonas vandammei]